MKVFLDDVRQPEDCVHYMYKRIGNLNPLYLDKDWQIVRNYEQFVKLVSGNYKYISHISFDHDLGEDVAVEQRTKGVTKRKARQAKKQELTGYDCAKWLKQFYTLKEKGYSINIGGIIKTCTDVLNVHLIHLKNSEPKVFKISYKKLLLNTVIYIIMKT